MILWSPTLRQDKYIVRHQTVSVLVEAIRKSSAPVFKHIRTVRSAFDRKISPDWGKHIALCRITRYSYKAPIRREAPLLGDSSRVTALALLIASTGSAIWKLTRLKGFGNRFRVQDYGNRNAWRGNEVKL